MNCPCMRVRFTLNGLLHYNSNQPQSVLQILKLFLLISRQTFKLTKFMPLALNPGAGLGISEGGG